MSMYCNSIVVFVVFVVVVCVIVVVVVVEFLFRHGIAEGQRCILQIPYLRFDFNNNKIRRINTYYVFI